MFKALFGGPKSTPTPSSAPTSAVPRIPSNGPSAEERAAIDTAEKKIADSKKKVKMLDLQIVELTKEAITKRDSGDKEGALKVMHELKLKKEEKNREFASQTREETLISQLKQQRNAIDQASVQSQLINVMKGLNQELEELDIAGMNDEYMDITSNLANVNDLLLQPLGGALEAERNEEIEAELAALGGPRTSQQPSVIELEGLGRAGILPTATSEAIGGGSGATSVPLQFPLPPTSKPERSAEEVERDRALAELADL